MSAKEVKNLTKEYLYEEYVVKQKSVPEIAEAHNTYPNAIKRKMRAMGIPFRSNSEAQKIALEKNRASHPTEGRERTPEEREKIGEKQYSNWKDLSDEEKAERAETSRKNWEKKSKREVREMHEKAIKGVQKAAEEGSRLEHYLKEEIEKSGYQVSFHKTHFLVKEKLELDLFIPSLRVAIEVDGENHFSPIWGQATFQRVQKADRVKAGLILNSGMVMLRVKALNNSATYFRKVSEAVISKLNEIKENFPDRENRYIVLDVE